MATLKDFCHYKLTMINRDKYGGFGRFVAAHLAHIYSAPITQSIPNIARLYDIAAKNLATIIETNIEVNFFKRMDKGIRVFLLSNGFEPNSKNRTLVMKLICGQTLRNSDQALNDLGGYRFRRNECQVPPDATPDDASILQVFVWDEQRYFRVNDPSSRPINEIWVKRNKYIAQLASVRYEKQVVSYNQHVEQQNKIKVWNVSPIISLRPHDLTLDSDLLFMVALEMRFFDPTMKVYVYIPKHDKYEEQKIGYKNFVKSGLADLVYSHMFHQDVKESKRYSGGRLGLKLRGNNHFATIPDDILPRSSIPFIFHHSTRENDNTYVLYGNYPPNRIPLVKSKDKPQHDFSQTRQKATVYANVDLVTFKPVFNLQKDLTYNPPTNDAGLVDDDLGDVDRPVREHATRYGQSFWVANQQALVDLGKPDSPQYEVYSDCNDALSRLKVKRSNNRLRKRYKKKLRRYNRASTNIKSYQEGTQRPLLMGVDPGLIDLMHGVVCFPQEGLDPESVIMNRNSFDIVGNVVVTSACFRNQGGGDRHHHRVAVSEQQANQDAYNLILSAFSSKQDSLDSFIRDYLNVLHSPESNNLPYGWKGLFGDLKKEKSKLKYRIYDALRYRQAQKFYAQIVNNINAYCIKNSTWIEIYYGGANIKSTMKGLRGGGVPTKAMRNLMTTHFDTHVVDEYYTSQVCDSCFNRLHKCMNKSFKVNGSTREIRGVRRCDFCARNEEPTHNKSRDRNAAMNMIIVGINSDVNDNFQRGRFNTPQARYHLTFYPSKARTNGEELERVYNESNAITI